MLKNSLVFYIESVHRAICNRLIIFCGQSDCNEEKNCGDLYVAVSYVLFFSETLFGNASQ